MPEKYVATKTAPRVVRMGDTDFRILECWYDPSNKDQMGRRWFDWADTIQTATYRLPALWDYKRRSWQWKVASAKSRAVRRDE